MSNFIRLITDTKTNAAMITSLLQQASGLIQIHVVKDVSKEDNFYYNHIYFKKIISFYQQIQQNESNGRVLLSNTPFNLSKMAFGVSSSTIKRMGKPAYKFQKHPYYSVLFYHVTINDIPALMQIQFLYDTLFFIGFNFGNVFTSDAEREILLNAIIGSHLTFPIKKNVQYPVVKDTQQHYLLISDDVHFCLCFVDGTYTAEHSSLLERTILLSLSTEEHPERI